jgi:hypothetical protein
VCDATDALAPLGRARDPGLCAEHELLEELLGFTRVVGGIPRREQPRSAQDEGARERGGGGDDVGDCPRVVAKLLAFAKGFDPEHDVAIHVREHGEVRAAQARRDEERGDVDEQPRPCDTCALDVAAVERVECVEEPLGVGEPRDKRVEAERGHAEAERNRDVCARHRAEVRGLSSDECEVARGDLRERERELTRGRRAGTFSVLHGISVRR